eukprot:TRINITY_DN45116_c0_g1_i1.p1 TRINITY_DN45116_c0_g1~~TRINITY_DN45116_c0_g1_i1.p1  ORF type:complete len:556 (-),score=85.87 TRINITY_DN45116_c0_g1_i1:226-1893(-)
MLRCAEERMASPSIIFLISLGAALTKGVSASPAKREAELKAATDDAVNFAVSCMLFGSMAFIMIIFYLITHDKNHIRDYSWTLLDKSICTFLSVQINSTWNGLLGWWLPDNPSHQMIVGAYGGSVLLAYMELQLVLAWVSGAVGGTPKSAREALLNSKCLAVLLGCITGVSGMNFWARVQEFFKDDEQGIFKAAAVVPFATILSMLICMLMGVAREKVAEADDGVSDIYEKLWMKFGIETENQAVALIISHTTIQTVRFVTEGTLPPFNGMRPVGDEPSLHSSIMLLACIPVFVLVMVISDLCTGDVARLRALGMGAAGNCIAFVMLHAFRNILNSLTDLTGACGSMLYALVAYGIAYLVMEFLHVLVGLDCTGPKFDQELRHLMTPLSVLVGFAWQAALNAAVAEVTDDVHVLPKPVETLIIATMLILVVVPVWRLRLLPNSPSMKTELAKLAAGTRADVGEDLLAGESSNDPTVLRDIIHKLNEANKGLKEELEEKQAQKRLEASWAVGRVAAPAGRSSPIRLSPRSQGEGEQRDLLLAGPAAADSGWSCQIA